LAAGFRCVVPVTGCWAAGREPPRPRRPRAAARIYIYSLNDESSLKYLSDREARTDGFADRRNDAVGVGAKKVHRKRGLRRSGAYWLPNYKRTSERSAGTRHPWQVLSGAMQSRQPRACRARTTNDYSAAFTSRGRAAQHLPSQAICLRRSQCRSEGALAGRLV
jgi:hypothetical protein